MLPKLEHDWDRNLGDIVLGVPVIEEVCKCDGVRLVDRLPVLVTHGLCHLVGHRHSNKEQWEKVSIALVFIQGSTLVLGLQQCADGAITPNSLCADVPS